MVLHSLNRIHNQCIPIDINYLKTRRGSQTLNTQLQFMVHFIYPINPLFNYLFDYILNIKYLLIYN